MITTPKEILKLDGSHVTFDFAEAKDIPGILIFGEGEIVIANNQFQSGFTSNDLGGYKYTVLVFSYLHPDIERANTAEKFKDVLSNAYNIKFVDRPRMAAVERAHATRRLWELTSYDAFLANEDYSDSEYYMAEFFIGHLDLKPVGKCSLKDTELICDKSFCHKCVFQGSIDTLCNKFLLNPSILLELDDMAVMTRGGASYLEDMHNLMIGSDFFDWAVPLPVDPSGIGDPVIMHSSPECDLITSPGSEQPEIKLFNVPKL